jgi:hypothetical protein
MRVRVSPTSFRRFLYTRQPTHTAPGIVALPGTVCCDGPKSEIQARFSGPIEEFASSVSRGRSCAVSYRPLFRNGWLALMVRFTIVVSGCI